MPQRRGRHWPAGPRWCSRARFSLATGVAGRISWSGSSGLRRSGAFSYEVTDTKLKRRPHPKHVLQLVLYSDLLTEIQGVTPEFAHVELGDGTRATLRLADYAHYARRRARGWRLRGRSRANTARALRRLCALPLGRPLRRCLAGRGQPVQRGEHQPGQVKKLEAAGIATMAALASMMSQCAAWRRTHAPAGHAGSPAACPKDRGAGVRAAARGPGKGFDLLPEPQAGDIFYDIEGDPHFEGGLEYLHGIWFDGQFRAFWAHDHRAEAQALSNLLDFFRRQAGRLPEARIYHYAAYEITALRRLTTKYGIGEAFLDRLLRERRFVRSLRRRARRDDCSEPNYSIKSLEVFYGLNRKGEVKTAGGSVVAYENWRETGDQAILDEIEDYNRTDCISTERLRDWLVGIRPEGAWPLIGEGLPRKRWRRTPRPRRSGRGLRRGPPRGPTGACCSTSGCFTGARPSRPSGPCSTVWARTKRN